MGINAFRLWLAAVFSLFIGLATTSPITDITTLNSSLPAANGFPFNTKFEPLVNAGIRHLKQYYRGADLFLVHSEPAALPWAYLETDFENFEIEAREAQQYKLAVQLSDRDHVGEWKVPFTEDWPFGTKLRTWSLGEWRTSLKDILQILDKECDLPGPWSELQVMKYRSDRRLPRIKDELQLALHRVTTEKFAWILYGMESGLVHKTDLGNATLLERKGTYFNSSLADVQTS